MFGKNMTEIIPIVIWKILQTKGNYSSNCSSTLIKTVSVHTEIQIVRSIFEEWLQNIWPITVITDSNIAVVINNFCCACV